jgi:quercetin 2,3-dioxygenase
LSGPVSTLDAPPTSVGAPAEPEPCVQILLDRETTVGAMRVRRALPRRRRRTVGAWCFADHLGPANVTETASVDIGPHPHIGLHTVTWLIAGELLHRDSLGSDQVIRPGQLNLMTAGNGVVHSEEATGVYRGVLHGIQLWVAQPEATRHARPEFEHHDELPRIEVRNGVVTVLVGALDDVSSPARADSPLLGAELDLRTGTPSCRHGRFRACLDSPAWNPRGWISIVPARSAGLPRHGTGRAVCKSTRSYPRDTTGG